MENDITINDFARLNGCTLKTVLYYHKAGLLPEARRAENGYRVYGASEMERMLEIRRLRDLGMDLSHIKEVLGDDGARPMQAVLMELRADLMSERQDIEARIARIDELLQNGPAATADDLTAVSSFDEAMGLLGEEEAERYRQDMPEMYEQQRRVMGLVESYDWGGSETRDAANAPKDVFAKNPEALKGAMALRKRMGEIAHLDPDDPAIEELAREAAEFSSQVPGLKEVLAAGVEMKPRVNELLDDMTNQIVPPALQRFNALFEQYVGR